jgi:hypothetical protein
VENNKPNNMEEKKEVESSNSEPKLQKRGHLKLLETKVLNFFAVFFKKVKSFFIKTYKIIKKATIKAYKKLVKGLNATIKRIKKFSHNFFSKTKAFLPKFYNKTKVFLHNIFSKTKIFVLKIFEKIKNLVKNIINKFKNLAPKSKIIVIAIIILIVTFSTVLTSALIVRSNNLSSYIILVKADSYENQTLLEQGFLTADVIEQASLVTANKNYILYKAMENNYDYYLPYLKEVKDTNEQFRNFLNTDLNELLNLKKDISSNLIQLQSAIESSIQEPDSVESTNLLHDKINQDLNSFLTLSVTLLPELENYISMYANEAITNKLQVYLTKLQFHYAVSIINKANAAGNISTNLVDLNSIIEKFASFSGESNSSYKNAFITAYENYSAYNYYAASDKVGFRLSLSGIDATYANAFYNFLSQASYN